MRFAIPLAALLLGSSALADEFTPAFRSYLESELSGWVNAPEIVAAIKAQNEAHKGLTQVQIDDLDKEWRSHLGDPDNALIATVVHSPLAASLRARIKASMGALTEVFVMDEHGLNVAASDVTSDMWQGDEAKFQQTFGRGGDSIHISDVALDASTQKYQGQISVTIVDPHTGDPIGAITIGVDAERLL